ncbi:MAG TPA: hypothetical protein VGB24_01145 [Longimicrobium sp.]|jgi:hypothetical protein|uniref:hypothetical protein n=1 Tax=Longimicrobium sp. TaxID=2029185 RepID=UPI002EDAD488
MHRLLPLFALSVLAACGPGDERPASTAAPGDSAPATVTTPQLAGDTTWALRFDGAGPLRVGMTVGEARAALGGDFQPDGQAVGAVDGPEGCQYARSGQLPEGMMVMLEGARVVRVEVDSGNVATVEGARIGDLEARIQQTYPGRVEVQPHKYTDGHYLVVRPADGDTTRLLVFETDGSRVLRFRAGQHPQVEYVEGCS